MSIPEESATMQCDWCKKIFPADSRACVEVGFDAVYETEEGEEWKDGGDRELTYADRERLKSEMDLDDSQLDHLLDTGSISELGGIICVECQDSAAEEAGIKLQ